MFRFTIRELVLITLVVALGVGWWMEHRKRSAVQRRLGDAEAGYSMCGDYLNQTVLALYELGIHWRPTNRRVILRPTTSTDIPPVEGLEGEPPIKPNFDISQFAGQRMPGSAPPDGSAETSD